MQHNGDVKLDGARVTPYSVVRARVMGPFKFPHLAVGPTMGAYNNSLQNAQVALSRRVLYKYVKSNDTYLERAVPSVDVVTRKLKRFAARFVRGAWPSVRCGLVEYPKLYTGGKRKAYERAVKSLLTTPLDNKDARVTGFVKVEATKLGADPRLIQTRSLRFHASLGQYLRHNEKALYAGVNSFFGERTITKGLNGSEIGQLIASKFNSFSCPVAIGLDASRFDRSVSVPILEWIHGIYRAQVGHCPDFERLLKHQIVNTGIIRAVDGVIKYDVVGGVMSGDVDTSLKGCLIMCAMVASWLETAGVPAKLINNGDDCVVFCDKKHYSKFVDGMADHFTELGFDIVAEKPVYEVEHVEFCQARPVISSDGTYVMCRNPIVASVKDSMSRVYIKHVSVAKAWAGSVADCGAALANDMPIFTEYYKVYARYAGGERKQWIQAHSAYANGLLWLSKGMSVRYGVTDATRISFWRAWDILPHVQRAIEEYYRGVTLGVKFEGPVENLPQISFHAPETVEYLANGS